MSGTVNPTTETNPLTDTEKTDIRRFMGYGSVGISSYQNAMFFTIFWENLEFKMTTITDSECVVVRNYLASLNSLETALLSASGNLDTASAGPWVHNAKEISDRNTLFMMRRRELCGFFVLPPGPALRSANSIRSMYN